MLISLDSGKLLGDDEKSNKFSRNTVKNVKKNETGVKMSWLYKLEDLETKSIVDVDIEISNEQDNGQYFIRPEGAIGIVVHTTKYPAVTASWYANNHEGFWNIYGELDVGTQQTFYLSGATTIFVGLF